MANSERAQSLLALEEWFYGSSGENVIVSSEEVIADGAGSQLWLLPGGSGGGLGSLASKKSPNTTAGGPNKTLRPFFGFYGGKWRDALKYYPAPEGRTIVEPFAGSAGYALRYFHKKVILCEIDPILASVWSYLIRVKPREIRAIPDLEPDQTVDDLNVCEEARWLVGFWLNRGVSTPRKSPSKWMRDGIRPGSFWGERVRNTIAAQVPKIRHWRVHNCSYENSPSPKKATWFVDPPYQLAGQHYRHGSSDIDYKKLADWCRARTGLVIVCENFGATWLPFAPLAHTKTTRAKSRSKEVVWLRQAKSTKRRRRKSAQSS